MSRYDTLFLDRDGVINKKLDGRYVRNFQEFEFIPGALNAISELSKLFKRIIVITNQQGIAKRIMSVYDLNNLHNKMEDEIVKKGGKIKQIYYCPHLEEVDCSCRKPKTGMIEKAFIDFPEIKVNKAFLVGDSDSDIEAGRRMNLTTVKVDNYYTLEKWSKDLQLKL